MKVIQEVVARHKAGRSVGVYSACSAHPLVIEAALKSVRRQSGPVLIEATSNQVNQDGGYTGMRPADFSRFVLAIAARLGVPGEQVSAKAYWGRGRANASHGEPGRDA